MNLSFYGKKPDDQNGVYFNFSQFPAGFIQAAVDNDSFVPRGGQLCVYNRVQSSHMPTSQKPDAKLPSYFKCFFSFQQDVKEKISIIYKNWFT